MSDIANPLNTLQEQEQAESDKPPSYHPRLARTLRVAVIANVKGETALPIDAPADAGAEFDKRETIQAIQSAIESDGHTTLFLSGDASLPYTLRETSPDLCFNIAEGLGGDGREAQVPALLEMMRVPYTASRVLTSAVALDKTMTKRIWHEVGLPTAAFQEFVTGDEPLIQELQFPMFVKPAREGTGMGMDNGSIIYNEDELRLRVSWVINTYHQPALVEEYFRSHPAEVRQANLDHSSRNPRNVGPEISKTTCNVDHGGGKVLPEQRPVVQRVCHTERHPLLRYHVCGSGTDRAGHIHFQWGRLWPLRSPLPADDFHRRLDLDRSVLRDEIG